MGLFTRTDDKHLEAARRHVVPGLTVCPGCKEELSLSGATLVTFNAALGLEGHACPSCKEMVTRRRPSPDGL